MAARFERWRGCDVLAVALMVALSGCYPRPDEEVADSAVVSPWNSYYVGPSMGNHGAALLSTGDLLVAGGEYGGMSLDSAFIWRADLARWSALADMPSIHNEPRVVALGAGTQALVIGGRVGFEATEAVERFDASARAWSSAPPMSTRRAGHTATVLRDGRVLVTGGDKGGFDSGRVPVATAEIYDPLSDHWIAAAPMHRERMGHSAALMGDDRIVVADACRPDTPICVERYDPATDTWEPGPDSTLPRTWPTLVPLPDGSVLLVDGQSMAAEVLAPGANVWMRVADSPTVRRDFAWVTLESGDVLLIGGRSFRDGTSLCDRYSTSHQTWSVCPAMNYGRTLHTATLMQDGTIMVVGGEQRAAGHESFEAIGFWETLPAGAL